MKTKQFKFTIYLLFLIYIISIISWNVYNPLVLGLIYIFLLYLLVSFRFRIEKILSLEVCLLIIYLITGLKYGISSGDLNFLLLIVFLRIYFNNTNIDEEYFIKFINYTYIVYILLSILLYFSIIPPEILGRDLNIFEKSLFGSPIRTFIGFGGSTADIDSYSSFVFTINLVLNKKKNRYSYIVLAAIILLLTFRVTPIIVIVAVVIYNIFSLRYISKNFSQMIFIIFSILCLLSFLVPYIFKGYNINFVEITHARDFIWNQYVDVIFNNPIEKVILGFRNQFPQIYIPWGIGGVTTNPHSSYLRLILSIGTMFIGLYIVWMNRLRLVKNEYRTIVISILIAAITNSEIFSLGNPVYIISIYYFIYNKPNDIV